MKLQRFKETDEEGVTWHFVKLNGFTIGKSLTKDENVAKDFYDKICSIKDLKKEIIVEEKEIE